MACKIIDVHHYGRYEKRPRIPKDPMCLPVDVHKKLVIRIIAVIVLMFGILLAYIFLSGSEGKESGGSASPASQSQRRSERDFSFFDALVTMGLFGGAVFYIVKAQEKVYTRLQDPMHNPRGCKYQGRILSTNDAHYRLHLDYYNAHGTWTLPDGLEHDAD